LRKYNEAKSKGLCTQCRKNKSLKDNFLCEECKIKRKEAYEKWRDKRKIKRTKKAKQ
tara:strand:- start:6771 stop:6941 length:171 start_codon:yes stop_codon:yes gene_type:complete